MNHACNAAALAQQQRDLLHAIFTTKNIVTQAINTLANGTKEPSNLYSTRGLQAYQANATATAHRSLQTAYPVIAQLIGDEAFAHLARDFWAQHPPTRGDLAQWGGELAGFIASIPDLKTEPYLSDVAKAEWVLHIATTAADKAADFESFSLLTEQDPDAVTLQLAPGTVLIQSQFPIVSILTAHLYAKPSFEEVGEKLRLNTPEIALVWRQGLRPQIKSCSTNEVDFVSQLLAGQSLAVAMEKASFVPLDKTLTKTTSFDFAAWLSSSVNSGLLLGTKLL